jgi:serine/threonine-protein kinase
MGRAEAANVEGEQARRRRSLTLGKYQLLAVLGRGGMAEVFLALSRGQLGFDKLVVVKRLREGLADEESFREMFLDEARLAARLSHPNVVHTYEVGEHEGTYFIAMEYLEGQPLNKVMSESLKRGTPLEPVVSARMISDALAGLHHAHTLADFDGRPLGIVHRDISPHNLFVTYEGVTKVVDFGIAKAALSSNETEVGVVKGKAAYMSPEQATGTALDARSDVFAMGIVLWELLTQQRLMTGDSAASTIHRLLTAPIPPASSLRRDVTPTLDAIVERALQKDPARRFQSALAMREAIEAYIASTGRTPRTDEIGNRLADMFVEVRAAIKQQIQKHVEGAARSPTSGPSESPGSGGGRVSEDPMASGDLPVLTSAPGISSSGVIARGPTPQAPPAQPVVQSGSMGGTQPSAQAAGAPPTTAPASSGVSTRVLAIGFALLLVAVIATTVAVQLFLGRQAGSVGATPAPPQVSTPAPPAPVATVAVAPTAIAPPPSAPARELDAPAPSQPTAKPAHKGHASAPPPPVEQGFITFNTYPWTRVSEGGASLGTTPLVHLGLPAGTHTLTLDNPDQGIHQTYAITVKAGELTTKQLGLK